MLFAYSLSINAQEHNYYKGKSLIKTDRYEYNIKNMANRTFVLQNVKNRLFDNQAWKYKDGRQVTHGSVKIGVEPSDINDVYNVFRSVFTEQEIEKMKLGISDGAIYYDDTESVKAIPTDQISTPIYSVVSSNGELLELQINFPNITIFSSIHPDKIFALEQALKEKDRITFKIPDTTKELVDYVIGIIVRVEVSNL